MRIRFYIIITFQSFIFSVSSQTQEFPDSYWIERAHIRPNPFIEKQVGGVVRDIIQDKKGNLWFGTEDGLYRFDGEILEFFDEIKNQFGQGVTVKEIVEDKKGNLWIGHTGGVSKYNGSEFTNYNENDGLISDDVWSLEVDKYDNIWIGTIDGVSVFNGVNFTEFFLPETTVDSSRGISSSKIVHCIFKDEVGTIWFGTNGGAYFYVWNELNNISEDKGLCNNVVDNIFVDNKFRIWFGTIHNGVCVLKDGEFQDIDLLIELKNKEIWDILEDSKGNIWLSVKHDGVYKYDGKTLTNYSKKDGLLSHVIMTIFEDSKGRIWCGGLLGLFRLDGDKFVNITREGSWE